MATCLEIVDKEYIEELKDRSGNEKMKTSTKFRKVGEWKKLLSKFRRVRERGSWQNTAAEIQLLQWILVKVKINITCVFRLGQFQQRDVNASFYSPLYILFQNGGHKLFFCLHVN